MLLEQEILFIERLSYKPFCTDDFKSGMQIRDAKNALTKLHIQHNSPISATWLVFDLDSPYFWSLLESEILPTPNLVVFNPENNHAHIYYSLKVPVYTSDLARQKPLRYLAAIEYALREKWGADRGYSGYISKNPIHPHWKTRQLRSESWTLGELRDWLTLPKTLPKRAQGVGLGRNCTLFDMVRYWAYDTVIDFRVSGTIDMWQAAVLSSTEVFNDFPEPLSHGEVAATAKSVAKWTWRHYIRRWTDDEFSHIQAVRGRLGGLKKGHNNKEKRHQVLEMRDEGMTQKVIAASLEVSERTVRRWLKSQTGQ